MSVVSKHWRLIANFAGVVLFAVFLFSASDAVHKCEVEEKQWSAEHRPHSRPSYAARFYRRVHVSVACAGAADDVWVALSGIAVAVFTFTLWRSTEKLWRAGERQREVFEKTSAEQTRIQTQTREIALAALDRPYLLIEEVVYRFHRASENRLVLYFDLKFRNYGRGPAIVRKLVAHGFLSSGVQGEGARDKYPAITFPLPDEITRLLSDRMSVRLFPEIQPSVVGLAPLEIDYRQKRSTLVIGPSEISPQFSYLPKDVNIDRDDFWITEKGNLAMHTCPWIVGELIYDSIYGNTHSTKFCFRGRSDGIAEEEYGAPYNERT